MTRIVFSRFQQNGRGFIRLWRSRLVLVTSFDVPEVGKLTPYSAIFFFSTGVLLSNLLFN